MWSVTTLEEAEAGFGVAVDCPKAWEIYKKLKMGNVSVDVPNSYSM